MLEGGWMRPKPSRTHHASLRWDYDRRHCDEMKLIWSAFGPFLLLSRSPMVDRSPCRGGNRQQPESREGGEPLFDPALPLGTHHESMPSKS